MMIEEAEVGLLAKRCRVVDEKEKQKPSLAHGRAILLYILQVELVNGSFQSKKQIIIRYTVIIAYVHAVRDTMLGREIGCHVGASLD
ncbi:hypothetical protein V6N11_000662 [Hibiscus sabdariffa]|uniref:Uncharacterized protein n=1 Tax=Hibiscus sabdariffa TaxID=183260 RepID=A0ABR2RXS3_9ROSI